MTNTLYYGDNLDILRRYIKDESIDLVYLDPPFNSNATYNVLFAEENGTRAAAQIKAFEDTWRWDQESARTYFEVVEQGGKVSEALQAYRRLVGESTMLAYLSMMAPRLVELRRVLKPTGSIYLHCDPTASHYLKLLMDAVFGPDGLIWLANPGLHRLEAYTPDGLLTRFWGTRGAGIESFFGCCNPADFAILPDGSFITAEKQIARIKRYDADGVFQSVVAPPAAFGVNMLGMDVAVNAQGQVLVLERGTRVVRVFAPVETGEGAMTKSETRNPNQ